MKERDKIFLSILKRIRRRMTVKIAGDNALVALAVMLGLGLILALIARFVPIYNVYGKIAAALVPTALFSLIWSLVKRPSLKEAALKADSGGLKERTVTAFELLEDNSSFAQFQREDAYRHLDKFEFKKHIKITPKTKPMLYNLGLVICLLVSAFVPNKMNDIAFEKHKLNMLKNEKIEKVKKAEKELTKNEKLTEVEKVSLQNKLQELKKELKEAKDEKEMAKSMEKTDKKLEMLKEKYDKKDLNKLADALAKSEKTKALSEVIKNNDTKTLKEAIKMAAQKMKNLSSSELKEMAENLSELAKEMNKNGELKEAVASLSQKLASGELGEMDEELQEFAESLEGLMNSDEFKKAVANAQGELKEGESGAISAQGEGLQGGSSPGSGSQPGQGQGQGSGAGSGTNMGEENPIAASPSSSGLSKKDGSERKEGEYEKIFTSKTLGGDADKSQLTGKKNNSGNSENVNSEKGINVRGESVPYNQVIGSYRESAVQNMETSDIPEGMKEIIKNYFTSLED